MHEFPKTGASIIVYKNKRTLLIKRGKEPYKGHWSLPGGSQELGETLEDCAKRELAEETQLKANQIEFAVTRDRINRDGDGNIRFHFVLTTFITTDFSGEPLASDDAEDIGWFTLEEMDQLKTTPETPAFISTILLNKGYL